MPLRKIRLIRQSSHELVDVSNSAGLPALRLRRRAVHFITDDASEAVAELILEHFVAAEAAA
jgi:hypothetical protein